MCKHLVRSSRVATFVSPHSAIERNESLLGTVVVGDQSANTTEAFLICDEFESVGMNAPALDEGQDLSSAVVETQRLWRWIRALSEVVEQSMNCRSPLPCHSSNGVANTDDIRVRIPAHERLLGIVHRSILVDQQAKKPIDIDNIAAPLRPLDIGTTASGEVLGNARPPTGQLL